MILKLKRNPIVVQPRVEVDEPTSYSLNTSQIPEAQKELLESQISPPLVADDTYISDVVKIPTNVVGNPTIIESKGSVESTASSFTALDKTVMHVRHWARHIYPTNKGDISWIFKTEKGMWFKIDSKNNFFTVSYGHGNIHSENSHWVKTHTWRESKDIAAAKQREAVTKKLEQEKPIAIVQKAMDEDVI